MLHATLTVIIHLKGVESEQPEQEIKGPFQRLRALFLEILDPKLAI